MGEEETKPNLERKGMQHMIGKCWHAWSHKKTLKLKTPTSELEDDYFTMAMAEYAVLFEEVQMKLGRYVTVNFNTGNIVAQTAIEDMIKPMFIETHI